MREKGGQYRMREKGGQAECAKKAVMLSEAKHLYRVSNPRARTIGLVLR